MHPTAWSRGALLAFGVVVMFACGDMRQDELDCELAVSRLQECCPGLDTSPIHCMYVEDCGGSEPDTYPAVDIPQSACIRGESCTTLVSTGVCKRVAVDEQSTYTQSYAFTGVCP